MDHVDARIGALEWKHPTNSNPILRDPSPRAIDPRVPQHDYPGYNGGRDYMHHPPCDPIDQDDCIIRSVKVEALSFVGRLDLKEYLDWKADMDHYFDWHNMS